MDSNVGRANIEQDRYGDGTAQAIIFSHRNRAREGEREKAKRSNRTHEWLQREREREIICVCVTGMRHTHVDERTKRSLPVLPSDADQWRYSIYSFTVYSYYLPLVETGFPRVSKSVGKHARRLSSRVCPLFSLSLFLCAGQQRDRTGNLGQIVILPSRLEDPQEVRALAPRGSPLCPANNGGANGRRSSELKREPADARWSRPELMYKRRPRFPPLASSPATFPRRENPVRWIRGDMARRRYKRRTTTIRAGQKYRTNNLILLVGRLALA